MAERMTGPLTAEETERYGVLDKKAYASGLAVYEEDYDHRHRGWLVDPDPGKGVFASDGEVDEYLRLAVRMQLEGM